MAAVRSGGFWLLKPWAIVVVNGMRAVVVEWSGLKPCCVGTDGSVFVMSGRISRSRILLAGHSREIGRYDLLQFGSLLGFRRGMMVADFQIAGIFAVRMELLNMLQR